MMTIEQGALDPARTLAILMGASKWEKFPNLPESRAYEAAAAAVREYLHSEQGLGLREDNVLDLFNNQISFLDQDKCIGDFLHRQVSGEVASVQDIIFYY